MTPISLSRFDSLARLALSTIYQLPQRRALQAEEEILEGPFHYWVRRISFLSKISELQVQQHQTSVFFLEFPPRSHKRLPSFKTGPAHNALDWINVLIAPGSKDSLIALSILLPTTPVLSRVLRSNNVESLPINVRDLAKCFAMVNERIVSCQPDEDVCVTLRS
jgi:hypothetical protein